MAYGFGLLKPGVPTHKQQVCPARSTRFAGSAEGKLHWSCSPIGTE